jgi:hypothetical protein
MYRWYTRNWRPDLPGQKTSYSIADTPRQRLTLPKVGPLPEPTSAVIPVTPEMPATEAPAL